MQICSLADIMSVQHQIVIIGSDDHVQGRRRQLRDGQAACVRALIKIRRAPKAQ